MEYNIWDTWVPSSLYVYLFTHYIYCVYTGLFYHSVRARCYTAKFKTQWIKSLIMTIIITYNNVYRDDVYPVMVLLFCIRRSPAALHILYDGFDCKYSCSKNKCVYVCVMVKVTYLVIIKTCDLWLNYGKCVVTINNFSYNIHNSFLCILTAVALIINMDYIL